MILVKESLANSVRIPIEWAFSCLDLYALIQSDENTKHKKLTTMILTTISASSFGLKKEGGTEYRKYGNSKQLPLSQLFNLHLNPVPQS